MKEAYTTELYWIYKNSKTGEVVRAVIAGKHETYEAALCVIPTFERLYGVSLSVNLRPVTLNEKFVN